MKQNMILALATAGIAIYFLLLVSFPRRSFLKEAILQSPEGFTSPTLSPSPFENAAIEPVSGPAPSSLNARVPYHLLQGVLKDASKDNQDNTCLNSCACYGKDFENRIQLTGNYIQRTNNYKRANPDSCSAPFHELVNNFYEVQTLDV